MPSTTMCSKGSNCSGAARDGARDVRRDAPLVEQLGQRRDPVTLLFVQLQHQSQLRRRHDRRGPRARPCPAAAPAAPRPRARGAAAPCAAASSPLPRRAATRPGCGSPASSRRSRLPSIVTSALGRARCATLALMAAATAAPRAGSVSSAVWDGPAASMRVDRDRRIDGRAGGERDRVVPARQLRRRARQVIGSVQERAQRPG